MTDEVQIDKPASRWAVSSTESVVYVIAIVFAVLSAFMNGKFFIGLTGGEPFTVPAWPVVLVLAGAGYLIKHRKRSPKDATSDVFFERQ